MPRLGLGDRLRSGLGFGKVQEATTAEITEVLHCCARKQGKLLAVKCASSRAGLSRASLWPETMHKRGGQGRWPCSISMVFRITDLAPLVCARRESDARQRL